MVFSKSFAWRCANMQALLPCIAQLSGLQLRELVLDIQSFPQPAAFLALFQWLPRTLRQLAVRSTEYRVFGVVAERAPLPPGLLPARVQTTALRQVRRQDMLAGVRGCCDGPIRAHSGSLESIVEVCFDIMWNMHMCFHM